MKLCPACGREYADHLNFCFDDGQHLQPSDDGPKLVCPKCLVRYAPDREKCPRDDVPLVAAGDVSLARERVCSECGTPAGDARAEFCGQDGARILPRWEVGLVARTAVPGQLLQDGAGDLHDTIHDNGPKTKPERPPRNVSVMAQPKDTQPDRPPAMTIVPMPSISVDAPPTTNEPVPRPPPENPPIPVAATQASSPGLGAGLTGLPADAAPPPAQPASNVPTPAQAPLVDGVSEPGPASNWFVGAHGGSSAGHPAVSDLEDAFEPVPTRVSRALIGLTIGAGCLFFGALGFAMYSRPTPPPASRVEAPPPPSAQTEEPTPAPEAPPPLPPPKDHPQASAAAPTPTARVAPVPTAPEKATEAPPPPARRAPAVARRAGRRRHRRPIRFVHKRAARVVRAAAPRARSGELDPSVELAAALRRATEAGRSRVAAVAPPAPRTVAPPAAPPPSAGSRLSRAEANRYFRDAASDYLAGRASDALRRFRLIMKLGPGDRDLQGRVALNMAHIFQQTKRCAQARAQYARAKRLLSSRSALHAKAVQGEQQLSQRCR